MPTIKAELRFPSTSTSRANELCAKLPRLKECTSSRSPTSSLTRMKWVQSSSMKGRPKRLEQGSRLINHTNPNMAHQPVKLQEQLMPVSLQMEACSQSRGAAWSIDLTIRLAKQLAREQRQVRSLESDQVRSGAKGRQSAQGQESKALIPRQTNLPSGLQLIRVAQVNGTSHLQLRFQQVQNHTSFGSKTWLSSLRRWYSAKTET